MTARQTLCTCTLFVLACGFFLGPAVAAEDLSPAPAPVLSVPLPASLTAPAGQDCAAEPDVLSGVVTNECGEGCSFESVSYCGLVCCGGWGACIDTMDGGYCVC